MSEYINNTKCPFCGGEMERVLFTEYEYDRCNTRTGRKRTACSHLECFHCGTREVVDESYDGPWHY